VPDHKPPFWSFLVGGRGRIWVRLYTEAVKDETAEPPSEESDRPPPINWEEPAAYDVFEHDGTYLGRVRLPPRTSASVVRGDTAWGVRRGELDEQYIVKMVIAPAGPGATE
jgi:hypothetical protein